MNSSERRNSPFISVRYSSRYPRPRIQDFMARAPTPGLNSTSSNLSFSLVSLHVHFQAVDALELRLADDQRERAHLHGNDVAVRATLSLRTGGAPRQAILPGVDGIADQSPFARSGTHRGFDDAHRSLQSVDGQVVAQLARQRGIGLDRHDAPVAAGQRRDPEGVTAHVGTDVHEDETGSHPGPEPHALDAVPVPRNRAIRAEPELPPPDDGVHRIFQTDPSRTPSEQGEAARQPRPQHLQGEARSAGKPEARTDSKVRVGVYPMAGCD